MPALNYLGISGTESSILDAASTQSLMNGLAVTQSKTISLIRAGWTNDPSGNFIGTNNYLTNSTVNTDQKTLTNILSFKNNVLNPCIQYADLDSESVKYVANSSVGVAGGVAALDSGGVVPLAQLPSMGSGYLVGPFGTSTVGSGTTANGPFKIAEWAIGTNSFSFQPLVFMIVNIKTSDNLGRPIVEVRISNGQRASYSASDPLVAIGTGRSFFADSTGASGLQPVSVLPCAPVAGAVGTSTPYSPSYNTYLSAWLYDGGVGTSSLGSGSVIAATAFLMRVAA